jgi:hypothetical protein
MDRSSILPVLTDKVGGKRFAQMRDVPVPTTYFEARAPHPLFSEPASNSSDPTCLNHQARMTISRAKAVCRTMPESRDLPPDFAFKATHVSGCNLLVIKGIVAAHRQCRVAPAIRCLESLQTARESESESSLVGSDVFSSNGIERSEALVKVCTNWLAQSYIWEDEWAYQHLLPGLVIEEVVWNYGGGMDFRSAMQDAELLSSLAEDLKCFAFDGRVPYLQHVEQRFGVDNRSAPQKRDTFYKYAGGGSWYKTNATMPGSRPAPSGESLGNDIMTRAQKLCAMLSLGFPFVRVDLLLQRSPLQRSRVDSEQGVQHSALFFGEMTFYALASFAGTPDLDVELGKWWCNS